MKIEFYSTIPAVKEMFPITESKKSIPEWVSLAKSDYMEDKEAQNIFRCPGIMDLFATGFTVYAWHDIEIGTAKDGHLSAYSPTADMEDMLGYPSIQVQGGDSIAKRLPKRPWSHPDILKINTPWHIVAPKGIKFMIIPITYTDKLQFEANIGILDPSVSNEINIQGYVQAFGTLKAGTPIAQIVPLSSDSCELLVRDMTEHDVKWVHKKKFLNNFSFIFNRKKVKESYNAHYEKKCPFHNLWSK